MSDSRFYCERRRRLQVVPPRSFGHRKASPPHLCAALASACMPRGFPFNEHRDSLHPWSLRYYVARDRPPPPPFRPPRRSRHCNHRTGPTSVRSSPAHACHGCFAVRLDSRTKYPSRPREPLWLTNCRARTPCRELHWGWNTTMDRPWKPGLRPAWATAAHKPVSVGYAPRSDVWL